MSRVSKSTLPEKSSGSCRIEKFEVTPGWEDWTSPGTYTRLMNGSQEVMNDTLPCLKQMEAFLNQPLEGSILLCGLGLGLLLNSVLQLPVHTVLVVELEKDIIDLVSPYFKDERITLVHADYKDLQLTTQFDFGYFDPGILTEDDRKYIMSKYNCKNITFSEVVGWQ